MFSVQTISHTFLRLIPQYFWPNKTSNSLNQICRFHTEYILYIRPFLQIDIPVLYVLHTEYILYTRLLSQRYMFYTRSPGQILSYLCRTLFLLHRVLLGSALTGLHTALHLTTLHPPPTYRAVCYFYIKFWWYFIYMIISSTFPPPLTHTYSCFEFWWLYMDYIYHSNPPPHPLCIISVLKLAIIRRSITQISKLKLLIIEDQYQKCHS